MANKIDWTKYFDQTKSREGTYSYKWVDYEKTDIIPLTVADMDLPTLPEVTEAIKRRADHNIYGYSMRSKNPNYKKSLITWYNRRYGINIDESSIFFTPGILSMLTYAIHAFTEAGDNILIQTPVYDQFANVIKHSDRNVVESKLVNNGKWEIDFLDFEEKIKKSKMFILCSPHNPLGIVWDRKTLDKLVEIASKYDCMIFSDEAHSDLVYDKKFTSLIEYNHKIIVATTIGKPFNCSGLVIANAIIKDESIRKQFVSVAYGKFHGMMANVLSVDAMIAAYNYGDEYLDNLLLYLKRNRDYMDDVISSLNGVSWIKPEATYLAWIKFDFDKPEERLLKAGLKVNPGSNYGDVEHCIRLNYAIPFELLKVVMDRIRDVVK